MSNLVDWLIFLALLSTPTQVSSLSFSGSAADTRLTNDNLISAILNGEKPNNKKFFVAIKVNRLRQKARWCVGSVIDKYWVITSAQYVHAVRADSLTVKDRDMSLSSDPMIERLRYSRVIRVFINPSFKPGTANPKGDIALLKVAFNYENNKKEKRIKILPLCEEPVSSCSILGSCSYGKVKSSETNQTIPVNKKEIFVLREGRFKEYPQTCKPETICVTGEAQPTQEDIGAPLYTFNHGISVPDCLYGVATFFRAPVDIGKSIGVSYFTRVASYKDWIQSTISSN